MSMASPRRRASTGYLLPPSAGGTVILPPATALRYASAKAEETVAASPDPHPVTPGFDKGIQSIALVRVAAVVSLVVVAATVVTETLPPAPVLSPRPQPLSDGVGDVADFRRNGDYRAPLFALMGRRHHFRVGGRIRLLGGGVTGVLPPETNRPTRKRTAAAE